MLRRRLIVGVYAAVGAIGAGAALALGYDPLRMPPVFSAASALAPLSADAASLGLGLVVAGGAIGSARVLVSRFAWARALHAELAPVLRGNSDRDLVVIALASGIAEELLFRGLGVQLLGVVLSSALFGALHQVRGPARIAWMTWAGVMGLLLAGIFALTGSLVGPIAAHVLTNAVNLKFVRDYDAPRRLRLAGEGLA